MTDAFWCLRALLGYWRRRPLQFLTLFAGLITATALWSGVQAINSQARQSYDKAAALMGGDALPFLAAIKGTDFPDSRFGEFRRAGVSVSPVLEGKIEVAGRTLRIIGIDPVSYPRDQGGLTVGETTEDLIRFLDPGRTLLSPATSTLLTSGPAPMRMLAEHGIPPLTIQPSMPDDVLVMDMFPAQAVLERMGFVSKLVATNPTALAHVSPTMLREAGLKIVQPEETISMDGLTDSFHLNLTAFGMLSFIVGLFMVHSATGLAFEQRRPLIRTLRACGISARKLTLVLIAELMGMALLGGAIGMVMGYLIAAALLPDVAASLRGLYGASIGTDLSLGPGWWLLGLGMSLAGALLATANSLHKAWRLPVLASAAPMTWYRQQKYWLRGQAMASVFLFGIAALVPLLFNGLVSGFVMIGALLLGAALLLPFVLSILVGIAGKLARHPLPEWFWADSRQQISGLSMALMALMLALSVNIGVGTMVESFRLTFTDWLESRLVSDLYINGLNPDQANELSRNLGQTSAGNALLPIRKVDQVMAGWPVEIYGFQDHKAYHDHWAFLQATPDHWKQVAAGTGVLVSEQLARRMNLSLNDPLPGLPGASSRTVTISGIFPDYGNPKGMIMMAIDRFDALWPDAPADRFGLYLDPKPDRQGYTRLISDITDRYALTPDQITDQAALKAYSLRIFDKTFAVTVALNSLTLMVAGTALLTGLLSLSAARLPFLAPLWAMGVTRKHLAFLELAKSLSLAAFTALFAAPFGLLLAWCLVAIVNVEAFGWRLPLHWFPGQWLTLFLLALLTALIASLYPALRLYRIRPEKLLKVFADER
ncbi:ABC transporter permease [Sneathiella chinensis]|uniref:ABC transporter permease n=1 Tax=Sneathiella chinensis TaxID=349750 RepID=A0ABQ5U3E7_9PROT|nr:ABC transporter permease [Sneathiella chinensis]GLQ05931.1 ABC transporter permease [Sneathiella chinensis]